MSAAEEKRLEDYALIGDLETAALVSDEGSIDWLCTPRFDSDASFAALVGEPEHGHWLLAPAGGGRATTRSYRGDTLVLQTRWESDDGSVDVVDFMPPRDETAAVVRIATGVSGRVRMTTRLLPRFGYGRTTAHLRRDGEDVLATAGGEVLRLESSTGVEARDGAIEASFTLGPGDRVSFVLHHEPASGGRPARLDPDEALATTTSFWEDWIGHCHYRGQWSGAVRRALVTLKALTYAPTGGIVAAATTSLPELVGGVRNWDYRYCWLRDATFALQALIGTGYVDEARDWREWLVRTVADHPTDLQVMYRVDGDRDLPERSLDWLTGYAGSRPVRVGNRAAGQRQLDVWGEVLTGLHHAREAGLEPTGPAWHVQRDLMDWLEGHWQEPDQGLWETRGEHRHYVHSKAMAWAGVDRAVRAVEDSGLDGPVERWRTLRQEIHDDVCERGYDAERRTFTQFYGSRGVDAALLLLPRFGFLDADDPRFRGTLAAVERELRSGDLVHRYDPEADGGDGMPHGESAFLACTFWYADALCATGRRKDAEGIFETLLGLRNDVGLLSEQYDADSGRQLGNTPQAFSMVGLVNTALQLGGADLTTGQRQPGEELP